MKNKKIIVFATLLATIVGCTSEPFLLGGGRGNPFDPCPPNTISFVNEIQPLIVSSCAYSGCHDAATAEDDVVLDTYENIMKEVKKGDPNNSELYEVLRDDPDDIMPPPPDAPLSDAQVQLVYDWIMQGAPNLICDNGCDTALVTFSQVVFPILDNQCIGCHNDARADGNVNLANYSEIKKYVDDGSLYGSITHTGGYIAMPPSLIKMSDCNIDKIRIWIENGAIED